jgi:hypothetical protein
LKKYQIKNDGNEPSNPFQKVKSKPLKDLISVTSNVLVSKGIVAKVSSTSIFVKSLLSTC